MTSKIYKFLLGSRERTEADDTRDILAEALIKLDEKVLAEMASGQLKRIRSDIKRIAKNEYDEYVHVFPSFYRKQVRNYIIDILTQDGYTLEFDSPYLIIKW